MDKKKRKAELDALTNAVNNLNLENHKVLIDYSQRLLRRYFLVNDLGISLTGCWDYEKINHFIMGYAKAYARFNNSNKDNGKHTNN